MKLILMPGKQVGIVLPYSSTLGLNVNKEIMEPATGNQG